MDEKPHPVSDSHPGGNSGSFLLVPALALMGLWKLVLAWCCLATFFVTPVVLFVFHTLNMGADPSFAIEFKWIGEYLRTVTVIIVSLAGLNTVELFKK